MNDIHAAADIMFPPLCRKVIYMLLWSATAAQLGW